MACQAKVTRRGGQVAPRGRGGPGPGEPSLPGMDALIRLDEVTKRHDSDAAPAVDGVNMQIAPGEAVAVMGPSGSGKSALLNMIAGLGRPTSGTVTVAGQRIGQLDVSDTWCEALFASWLQPSDAPTAQTVAEAITFAIGHFGMRGCVSRMAQEFGDHPDAATERMRWVRRLAAETRSARSPQHSQPPGGRT